MTATLEEIRTLAMRGSVSPACGCRAIHTQIRAMVEKAMERDNSNCIEALAEAMASMEGKLDVFGLEKNGAISEDDPGYQGSYEGYLAEAREMMNRLESRGYTVSSL